MADLYLGRAVDPSTMEETGEIVTLDPSRLTRHAVCLGMTGSGKTGLCVTLLEELAIAGVPVIVIDPKGDMCNLALAFSDHSPSDFAPWVDPAEADREGLSVQQLAEKLSARWRKGLAAHGVDGERIRAFTESADVKIYSPGSTAAIPVDVLGMLQAPPAKALEDQEGLRDLITGTVSALLGLISVDADPVKDPRHVLLARILETRWMAGTDVDLEALILALVDPPFQKVGVFPVDTFFPRKDRMSLAMELNGVVASPSFGVWSQGQPLDIDALMRSENGSPVRVFTLAHLGDAQRMFFSALLLNQIVSWTRRQPGSSALRALVYFDEVMGFLPPYPRNPPTKRPVLTLMKQARAVGVGTMLVTQNPVDVDYAALSNAGLWMLGRMQTRQDRSRVLDGLAGVGDLDKETLSGWLERLPSRCFLVKDVSAPAPYVMKSRWAISYLRGPLTRRELAKLDQDEPAPVPAPPSAPSAPEASEAADDGLSTTPPATPGDFKEWFLDPEVAFSARLAPHLEREEERRREDGATVWRPALYARLWLTFDEGREFKMERDEHRLFYPITDAAVASGIEPEFQSSDLLSTPPGDGRFHPLPTNIDEVRELRSLKKRVSEEVYRGETVHMFRHRKLKVDSRAGEGLDPFTARVRSAIQDRIDAKIAKLKTSVDTKVDRLETKQRKLERDIGSQESAVSSKQATEVLNIAETAFSWFTGRRKSLTTAMNKRGQTRKAGERLARSREELTELGRDLYDLEADLEVKITAIENDELAALDDIETMDVKLERADVRLDDFGILWIPVTREI